MNPPKVVDASAVCAIVFVEPAAAKVVAALDDARLLAPHLLDFEVANTCWKKILRYPSARSALLRGYALFQGLDIARVPVDLPEAISLAQHYGLTVYDASYLSLARRFDLELLTLDARLLAAMSA